MKAMSSRRFAYGALALVALAAFGAYSFRCKAHYWPGSHHGLMAWRSVLGWMVFTFGLGSFFGLQIGAFLGAIDYFGSRRRFTIMNSGFWMTFVFTDLFVFLVVPRMV